MMSVVTDAAGKDTLLTIQESFYEHCMDVSGTIVEKNLSDFVPGVLETTINSLEMTEIEINLATRSVGGITSCIEAIKNTYDNIDVSGNKTIEDKLVEMHVTAKAIEATVDEGTSLRVGDVSGQIINHSNSIADSGQFKLDLYIPPQPEPEPEPQPEPEPNRTRTRANRTTTRTRT